MNCVGELWGNDDETAFFFFYIVDGETCTLDTLTGFYSVRLAVFENDQDQNENHI